MAAKCGGCGKKLGVFSSSVRVRGQHVCRECARNARLGNEAEFTQRLQIAKVTTTGNFEGYHIQNYCGTVSAFSMLHLDIAQEWFADVRDWWGGSSSGYAKKFADLQSDVEDKLKFQSVMKGGNAVVGASFNISFIESNTGEKRLLSAKNVMNRKLLVSGAGTAVYVG